MTNLNLNKLIIISGVIAGVLLIIFWSWWGKKEISITNPGGGSNTFKNSQPASSIAGIKCENFNHRPIAVMVSSDQVARPLSGISEADIVFEMPVTPGGVTRIMAVYQCSEPIEIGSVRSAREAFIPLAAGLDAILAHWGGERSVLDELNSHVIDNLDGLKYETTYFYRKSGIKQPQNGFTSFAKLTKGISDFKYSTDSKFSGYPHSDKEPSRNITDLADLISINYPTPFDVKWTYDNKNNSYSRTRGDGAEIDKNTGNPVKASVVAVLETTGGVINKDYNTVSVAGQGKAEIYQNGIKITGAWKKDQSALDSKLFFYDNSGKEIEFAPGRIWVEIITN